MSFELLQHHYRDRLAAARAVHQAGGRVVGVVGNAVPLELILADGVLPVQVAPEPGVATPTADEWMEECYPWDARSIFDRLASGVYEFLDLVVVTRSYFEVYYYLKEVVRQGLGPRVPPLHMYDLMQSQRDSARSYGLGRTDDLLARLERLAESAISDASLRDAVAITNRQRQLLRRLQDLRRSRALAGTTAMQVIGAAHFMEPTAYADALAAYLDSFQLDRSLADRPRLLIVPSEPLSHLHLHETLEAAGGLVVAEDDWWGARMAADDIPDSEELRLAIFESCFAGAATPELSPREPREAWFRAQVAEGGIDGVVFYLPPSDRLLGWYYPGMRAFLEEAGMPSLLVRQDALDPAGRESIRRSAAEFVGTLGSALSGAPR